MRRNAPTRTSAEASMVVLQQDSDGSFEPSLSERVNGLIGSHEARPLLSTTGTQAAIAELAHRTQALELAVREIALEVQNRATPR
jgi:hypothetical protein